MRSLHIVLPMAGRGSRFADKGFMLPKPLIPVDGRPMFMKALSSLVDLDVPKSYTVIIRREQDEKYGLGKAILASLPEANLVLVDDQPTGALRDALRAEPYFGDEDGVLVMDCDLWFNSRPYEDMMRETLAGQRDLGGGLLVFKSDHPRYSYAKVIDGIVAQTAEKKVISDTAIVGAYFFASAPNFVKSAKEMLEQPLNEAPEYYIAPVYNLIIKAGGKIGAAEVEEYFSFGTPEELADYEARA